MRHGEGQRSRSAESNLHRELVAEYLAKWPGAQVSGFRRRVRALVASMANHEFVGEMTPFGMIPDAFVISEDRVRAVEVQVSSPVTASKFNQYIGLFWELDAVMVGFDLHLVDRNGSVFEVDMVAVSIEFINSAPPSPLKRLPGRFVLPPAPAQDGAR